MAGAACTAAAISRASAETTITATAKETPAKDASTIKPLTKGGAEFWLSPSLHRVYPTSTAQESAAARGPLLLKSGRNYRLSFQACYRNLETSSLQMECKVTAPE